MSSRNPSPTRTKLFPIVFSYSDFLTELISLSLINQIKTYISIEDNNFIKYNNITCLGILDHLQAWMYII
jgi:hypothetical protein